MAELYADPNPPKKPYWDKTHFRNFQDQLDALDNASTLYVGNLSFWTTEAQIYELFSTVGHVQQVIMGLDRFKKTPCGFCFVEYDTHAEALACREYISNTKLDDRIIRCELDSGFIEGRQYGRGSSGGQVRDERRSDFDAGRGGYGTQVQISTASASADVKFPDRAPASDPGAGAGAGAGVGESSPADQGSDRARADGVGGGSGDGGDGDGDGDVAMAADKLL